MTHGRVILSVAALSLAMDAAASEPPAIQAQLALCAAMAEPAARLACYDSLAAGAAAGGKTEVAEASLAEPAPAAAPPVPPTEDSFGLEQQRLRAQTSAPGARTEVEGTIAALLARRDGRVVVEFDNGQVWATTEPDAQRILALGGRVTIRRASMGSFLLVTDSRRSIRVRRLE